ncbi:MAG: PD40 domain-containing protein [Planctomycetes bacterium]|nr:PD40 domain-containing protein [Planctomycetota bacterium]
MSRISRFLFVVLAPLACFLIGGCQQYYNVMSPRQTPLGTGDAKRPNTSIPLKAFGENYQEMIQHSFSESGIDFDPFISVDGKTIIFASTYISPISDIFMKASGGRTVEQITHTPNANEKQPQLSPDGKSIIYASDREGKFNIYEISAVSRGSREREVIRNGRINEMPSYSPDGNFLVYSTWLPNKSDWHIAITDRRTQQERIYGPGVFPKFSPDGNQVLFQRARIHSPQWYSIWVMDLTNESVSEIISNDKWAAITPNWSTDGKRIVFASVNKSVQSLGAHEGDDIYTIWADGTHLVRLTNDDAPDWNPVWAKSGRIFFLSKRNGFQNVWSFIPKNIDPFHPDSVEMGGAKGALEDLSRL